MALRDEVAVRLKSELRRQGRSAEWLAKAIQRDQTTVNRLLRGSSSWKLDYVDQAAVALDVSPAWLLGYDPAVVPEDVQAAIAREVARQLAALDSSRLAVRAEPDPLAPPREKRRA